MPEQFWLIMLTVALVALGQWWGVVALWVWLVLEAMGMNIQLPWPPIGLSPNARNHWAKTAKLKKQYREACFWQAMEQGARSVQAEKLHLTLDVCPANPQGLRSRQRLGTHEIRSRWAGRCAQG